MEMSLALAEGWSYLCGDQKEIHRTTKDHTLENLYVLSNKGGKERIIVLTGEDNDFDQDYVFSDEMKQALSEDKMVKSDIYVDSYGTHKSVFYQLKIQAVNSRGF